MGTCCFQLVNTAEPYLSKITGGAGTNRGAEEGQAPPANLPVMAAPSGSSSSNPNRKTRALYIGINYTGTKSALRGCVQDVQNVSKYVGSTNIFKESLFLTDDQQEPAKRPTRENIIAGFKWLVAGAQDGDAYFMHYSGHGATQKDTDGDETSGLDQTIAPLDYEQAGQITDDEMNAILVHPLPKGVRLTAVFDCCHSGSALDLPYTYSVDAFQAVSLVTQKAQGGQPSADADAARKKTIEQKSSEADVVMFSGCKDSQTSADAVIDGSATGAMSWALLAVLSQNPNPNLTDLLRQLREKLHATNVWNSSMYGRRTPRSTAAAKRQRSVLPVLDSPVPRANKGQIHRQADPIGSNKGFVDPLSMRISLSQELSREPQDPGQMSRGSHPVVALASLGSDRAIDHLHSPASTNRQQHDPPCRTYTEDSGIHDLDSSDADSDDMILAVASTRMY
ncbi:hypothetical protein BSLG_004323 [Batrachochytrium salamandrivorans]|nr:hypothetical protein BSLG_004323 [Batrachochytrium salamandrivorans]